MLLLLEEDFSDDVGDEEERRSIREGENWTHVSDGC